MECRPFNITLRSAEGLEDVRTFSDMRVYAVVSIGSSEQKTEIDKTAGTDPSWNCSMMFGLNELKVQENGLLLVIKLFCERTLAIDKFLGQVSVSIKEIFDVYKDKRSTQVACYQVYNASQQRNGKLNLEYRFGRKFTPKPPKKRNALLIGGLIGLKVLTNVALNVDFDIPVDFSIDANFDSFDGFDFADLFFDDDIDTGCSTDDF